MLDWFEWTEPIQLSYVVQSPALVKDHGIWEEPKLHSVTNSTYVMVVEESLRCHIVDAKYRQQHTCWLTRTIVISEDVSAPS